MDKTILLKPRLSEKTYTLGTTKDKAAVYVFDVPTNANKQVIAGAVAAQYEVTVTAVNITNVKGKAKRLIRKGGRAIAGQRSDTKKAYVTLKLGDKLPFFDDPEAEKKEKAAEKADKKAKKAAKKEEKK